MWVEIAEVPFEVRCRYMDAEAFFSDYRTDKEPQFVIEPTDADLQEMQATFDKKLKREGKLAKQYDNAILEEYAILVQLSKEMVFRNVLMLHGSALCMDGEAYIFTARSGTGKSTHARFWRETFGDRVWMINDDQPMLRIEDDKVTVFGTPWDGKHHLSCNASAPLKAIAWLRRAETNSIRQMPKEKAFPILLDGAFGSNEPAVMAQAMQLEAKLLDAIPFYELGCNMTTEAALVAWEGMHNQSVPYEPASLSR